MYEYLIRDLNDPSNEIVVVSHDQWLEIDRVQFSKQYDDIDKHFNGLEPGSESQTLEDYVIIANYLRVTASSNTNWTILGEYTYNKKAQ